MTRLGKSLLTVVFALFAQGAAAQVSLEARLDDCFGLRSEARAHANWLRAPCQDDGSCGAFDRAQYDDPTAAICIEEALHICALEATGTTCRQNVRRYLEDATSVIDVAALRKALRDRLDNATGFSARLARRSLDDLEQNGTATCPNALRVLDDRQTHEVFGPEGICNWFELISQLEDLRRFRAIVSRWGDE